MSAAKTLWALAVCLLAAMLHTPLMAQTPGGPAQIEAGRSSVTATGNDRGRPRPLTLTVGVSQPMPYRVALLDSPPRLVVDLKDTAAPKTPAAEIAGAALVPAIRWSAAAPGWARVVMELPGPMAVTVARLRHGAGVTLEVMLDPVADKDFAPRADSMAVLRGLPEPTLAAPAPGAEGPLRIVLDPGHGGIDPGAQVGAITEAALMLGFARELGDVLRAKGFQVDQTRDDDRFIPLERRTTIARAKGADLFISLHADALPAGEAAGATIYTWNPESNDRAARQLAMRHDRDDLLAGVDLADTDEEVTRTLIDLARLDTQPRSEDFARHLTRRMGEGEITMHRVPMRGAAFSVLKSPDIPSILLEVGFLTDPTDRAHLFDPDWRQKVAHAIAAAAEDWVGDDAARSARKRQPDTP